MKLPRIFSRLLLISSLFAIYCAPVTAANSGLLPGQNPQILTVAASRAAAGFRLPVNSTLPIIEYRQNITMLENQGSQPQVQVFSDGRVRVHYPPYMKKAGDYEFVLTRPELILLIQSLSANGLMDFDHVRVRQDKSDHDLQMKARGELHYVTDAVETLVDIRLQDYQKTVTSPVKPNLATRFSWKNLEQDANYYKNNRSIQSAAAAVKLLDGLMHHTAMKKIK